MDIFFEIHSGLPREGPGDNVSTKRAFSFLTDLPSEPLIVDIGCGPGMQTVQLAKLTEGKIIAVDTHQPFLDELTRRARQQGVEGQINTRNLSMFDLPFEEDKLDVIWAESSIYIYGFMDALNDWKRFLKKGGYFVASELSWVKLNPPNECARFWEEAYPQIKSVEDNLRMIKDLGYKLVQHFEIPKQSWMDNYYTPLKKKINALREKYKNNEEALDFLEGEMEEIRIFDQFHQYYGYVFYIMQNQ
jgi:ubiquinone/menaquinone biosynthesis C-methylase UbiE